MNLFDAIGQLHTDVAKFAFRDLGSAAATHTVIGVRNHLAKLRAGTVNENGDPIEPEDQEGLHDASGEEFEGHMRTEQGNPPAQPPLHRAEFLNDVRLACTEELKAIGVTPPTRRDDEPKSEYMQRVERFKKWNWPQNPAEVLRFFQSTEGKTPVKTEESFNRLVEKGILSRDAADKAIAGNKAAQAKQWADIAEEILVEIDGFDTIDAPDGAEAVSNLEPWMQLKLYDDTIKRLKGSCSRFVASVALGQQERFGTSPAEAEAVAFLFQKEQDKLVQYRREFYKQHGAAIEANQRELASV